jgi:hypothetical protein
MNTQSTALIGNSIVTLRRLAEMLSTGTQGADRTSKEILLSISVLLPKLEAARPMFDAPPSDLRCDSCED